MRALIFLFLCSCLREGEAEFCETLCRRANMKLSSCNKTMNGDLFVHCIYAYKVGE